MIVMVNKDFPARTLQKLQERLRASPAPIDYASAGNAERSTSLPS